MVVRWSEKLEDRFAAAFAIPGFHKASTHVGDAGIPLLRYLDFDVVYRDPSFCRLAVELLGREVRAWAAKTRVDYIAFLEKRANTTGAIILAGALTIYTGIPHLVIRLRKDITHERIPFPAEAGDFPLKNANVVLLTDYATTGRELQPAVRAVRGLGGEVVGVVVLVWDDERFNRKGEMSEVGITEEMFSLLTPVSEVDQIAKESQKTLQTILTGHR